MINDELNSRSVNFLGLVASLDLFITLSPVLLSILLINNKTPLSNYLYLIKSLFFWILERRFSSFSILQISLWTGNFYYLTGLDNLLSIDHPFLRLLPIDLLIPRTFSDWPPILIILIWLNLCSFWILERRFGSCSILQISLRTGNFYYLTRSRHPLVKFGAFAGDPKATIWSFQDPI